MEKEKQQKIEYVQPQYYQIKIDDCIQKLKLFDNKSSKFCLTQQEINGICYKARKTFIRQPMLLQINPPVNVCGDIHGQFQDLLTIFKIRGDPSKSNYLFLGDYVDRGKKSLQTICLLFCYKIKYPQNFFLIRGNHQCYQVNRNYGFYDQCKQRVSLKIWKVFSNCFNYLPIAGVIGQRIFCCHGGLSPFLKQASDINKINRPVDFTKQGIVCDILWSDPKQDQVGFGFNSERGVSCYYGKDIIHKFLKINDFDLICRSHQVVQQGYQFFDKKKLVTVFSAPNYCGMFDNDGGILVVDENMICKFQVFESQFIETQKPLSIKRNNYLEEQFLENGERILRRSRNSSGGIIKSPYPKQNMKKNQVANEKRQSPMNPRHSQITQSILPLASNYLTVKQNQMQSEYFKYPAKSI